jgi:sialate O-acetylesterase
MYRRFQAVGSRVKGVLWYQGEADANPKTAPLFLQTFENFIAAVRRDLNDPELPFYYVQLGRHINYTNEAEWNLIQESQRRAESVKRTGVVAAADLGLDDGIHVGTPGLKRLGVRLANLAIADLFPASRKEGAAARGPRPISVEYRPTAGAFGVIRIRYSAVNGKLQSDGRIGGFSLHDEKGEVLPMVYRVDLDPADPTTVMLHVQGKLPPNASVHYGHGKDPYCNLRDSADMAALVFGPMPVKQ